MEKNLLVLKNSGSLENYLNFAYKYPMLTLEEEKSLAQDYRYNNNIQAAQKLILSHLKFVVKIARGFLGYGLSLADLVQEGTIGLMKAVKRFNPELNVRLVAFAVYWIKSEIHEFVLKNWRIVKIATTKEQRKLFFNLRNKLNSKTYLTEKETNEIALELKVKPTDVKEMEKRLNSYDVALESPSNALSYDGKEKFYPLLYLEDSKDSPDIINEKNEQESLLSLKLQEALSKLDERSKDIIYSRWLKDKKETLINLSKKHNISAERVRQIENLAFSKIKPFLKDMI